MFRKRIFQILNNLAQKAKDSTYKLKFILPPHINKVQLFMHNAISENNIWFKMSNLSPILISTDGKQQLNCYNRSLMSFTGIIESIEPEVKHYDMKHQDTKKQKIETNQVFIAHGHNDETKLAVKCFVSQLGLIPIILDEQPNKGKTIIEKLENIAENVNVAIIILSADDKMENGTYRARQNVILELGYFVAKLGRENVITLISNNSNEIDIPSDISGVIYESYDSYNGSWRYKIVKELKARGFNVDANRLS